MKRYSAAIQLRVQSLRSLGKTYSQIKELLDIQIPKSTLSGWCHNVVLPSDYTERLVIINQDNLNKAREVAWKLNKIKTKKLLNRIKKENMVIAKTIEGDSTGLIALAMLCLGEASKIKSKHKQFSLGSSDPRIIIIFLALLKRIEGFEQEKIRCTVQCRADQNVKDLEKYWRKITKIPKRLFYSARIDPRTIGKPTIKKDYKGVLVVDYYDRRVQLRLETLADLVYNQLKN